MKKFIFFLVPLMAISFLTNCGGQSGPKQYTVTFDTGDGGSIVHPQTVIENQYAIKPANPTRDESDDAVYTFKEWQLNGNKFEFTNPITENITLKAEWNVINKFIVTFNSNGGTPVANQKVAPNKCATKPNDPTKEREGYTCSFLYWELDNKEFKFDTPINKNIILTAKWQETIKRQYTVSVTSEDEAKGTVTGGGSYDYGSSVTIEATPNSGYSFEGWYKDGEKVPSAPAFYTFIMPINDVSYEARFTISTYTVTLTASSRLATSEGGTVTGKGTYTYGYKVTIEAKPNTGYKFNGWYDGKTFISDEPTYNFNMPAKNITYTAKFVNENAWFFKSDWWTYCSNGNDREQAIKDDVGQEVNLTVNNQVHKVRLIDINHDVLNDDSSKTAHCTFEFVNLLSDKDGYSITTLWNTSNGKDSTNYDYLNSDLRKALDGQGTGTLRWYQKEAKTKSTDTDYTKPVIEMLPSGLQSNIKRVKKFVATTSTYSLTDYDASVFALTHNEMTKIASPDAKAEGITYQYYKDHNDDSSRIKHQINWHSGAVTSSTKITDSDITWNAHNFAGYNNDEGDSYGGDYWLASPCIRFGKVALGVIFNGQNIRDHVYDTTYAVAPAFCI